MTFSSKFVISTIILVTFIAESYSQNVKVNSGKYTFKDDHGFESILFKPNGQFIYERNQEFIKEKICGNWQTRGNQVILDSYPQRDRLIVFESYNKRSQKERVYVFDKRKQLIHYTLYYITALNDTISLKNQWQHSEINSKVKSFFLVDNKGLVSPIYKIEGSRSNVFEVFFETQRVFENESWEMQEGQVFPKNGLGEKQKYALVKYSIP